MFQSFYKMFGKWTQVQTYGEANKFRYIEKNHRVNGNQHQTPNIKMYKIKRCRRKRVTIIKGKFCLFAKMTRSTIKFWKLN